MDYYEAILQNKNFIDFNPLAFGFCTCPANRALSISDRHYCLIHYIVSGKGTLYINNTSYTVKENQIFIIPKNTINSYIADNDDPWTYIWIGFDGRLASQFKNLPPVIDFHSDLFNKMTLVSDIGSMQEEFLAGKLFELYSVLFSNNSIDIVVSIKNYINSNYMSPNISVEKIALTLHLNRSYLTRYFKQNTGITIQAYLIQTRISHACKLLQSGLSVTNTANMVGYLDVFNFSKIFKKHVGISPSDYRHSNSHE